MSSDLIRALRCSLVALSCALATPALAQGPSQSDLQALRFYLQQDNDRAVRAELQRLQIQFPDWSPPDDLSGLVTTTGPDSIDQIYRLIEAEEFESARRLISETDSAYSDWSPPSDLLDLLAVSEAQVDFDAAVAAGRPETAISIMRRVPNLLSCERINNAWSLADMHQALGETPRALVVFRSVINTCTDPEVLIATLEKADEIATLSELGALADTARTQAPDDAARIRQVEDRLRAGRGEEPRWGNNEQAIDLAASAPERAEPAAGAEAANDTTPRAPSRPAQLTAAQAPPSGGGGNLAAARAAAQRGAWSDCLALTAGATRIDLVYERAWCSYNAERPMEAVDAFRRAAQAGSSATMRRDATYGWLLALLKMNMTEQAAQVLAGAQLTRDQRLEIESQILDQRGVRSFNQGNYGRAIAFFEEHERLTGHARRDLTLLKGYALLNSGNRPAAREVFMRMHRQLSTAETRQALRAAQ
ncbi:MAG: hypothetical protein EA386_03745 [Rhodobacteraceae bacterium]|nr:MAG: hypothetical protein EA386_03745 [Paracoccaceae bacterium]